MNLTASSSLLIPERYRDEVIRTIIENHVDFVNKNTIEIDIYIQRMLDVETARGIWLDLLGLKVGIKRLFIVNDGSSKFGFEGVNRSKGFLQAPFHSTEPDGEYIGLADEIFRLFVKSRGILCLSNGTLSAFEKGVKTISPESFVIDNRNMSITIYTDKPEIFDLAEKSNALPRSLGVRVNYVDRKVFGFDQSGVGFNQGRFRP